MSATWTKGRSGDWLVRAEPGLAGRSIQVTKKAGGVSVVTLAREIWAKDGVALYTTTQSHGSSRHGSYGTTGGRWTGCSCGSLEDTPRESDCASCRFDNE